MARAISRAGWLNSIAVVFMLGSGAVTGQEIYDPWEGFNRKSHAFNDVLDRHVLRPVAKGYKQVTPDPVERGVRNFFDNLLTVRTIANDVMQLKFKDAGGNSLRFLLNSTVGLFGFIDIGSRVGLIEEREDFGQTLGYWGVGPGPYLVLPFLGPSTLRDTGGRVADLYWSDFYNAEDLLIDTAAYGLNLVSIRARLLGADTLVSGDRYAFMRDAYLQRRQFQINDGSNDGLGFDDDLFEDDLFDEELGDEL